MKMSTFRKNKKSLHCYDCHLKCQGSPKRSIVDFGSNELSKLNQENILNKSGNLIFVKSGISKIRYEKTRTAKYSSHN